MAIEQKIRDHFEAAARLEAEVRDAGCCGHFTVSLGFMLGQLARAVGKERALRFAAFAVPPDDPELSAVLDPAHPDHGELMEIVTAAHQGARKT